MNAELQTALFGLGIVVLGFMAWYIRNLPKVIEQRSAAAAERTTMSLEEQRVTIEERRDDIAQRTINKEMLMRLMVQTNQQEEKLTKQDVKLAALSETTTTLREQAQATEQRLNKQIADLQRQLREANDRATKLQTDVTSLEQRLMASENEREQLREQVKQKTEELQRHQKQIADLQMQVKAVENTTNGTGPLPTVVMEEQTT